MKRKPTDRLLMLVTRWDNELPHSEVPEQLKPLCEEFIANGDGRLADGVWTLTPTGFARSEALLDEIYAARAGATDTMRSELYDTNSID